MINDLRAIAIFAETVRQGSFRGAARVLDLSPSVVSYHIQQLEDKVGSALIYRSTRKLSLSHEGEQLFKYAQDMLDAVEQGISEISAGQEQPGGQLRITMPAGLAHSAVNTYLAQFHKQFPGIELHIQYTDKVQDILGDGIDLAIRTGELKDSSLKAKRLGIVKRILTCAPEYLQRQPSLDHPRQLSQWNWIKLAMMPEYRILRHGKRRHKVNIQGTICVDSVEAMTQLCIDGVGVATPPDYLAEPAIEQGKLVRLLPEWEAEALPLYASWPANVSVHSNCRRLIDYLRQAMH